MKSVLKQALGVVFDCFWWWRSEFRGQTNPFADNVQRIGQNGGPNRDSMIYPSSNFFQESNSAFSGDQPVNAVFSEEVVPDWDWAKCLEMPLDECFVNNFI